MNRKVYKHSNLFASINWQVVNQIDWYLRRTFTKDVTICVQTLRVIGYIPLQWELHTFYFEAISLVKTKKNRGLSIFPWKKPKQKPVFLSFGVDPLNWQSFIEIGEMACSTTVRCSRGHAVKTLLSFKYIQSRETKLSRWNMEELFMFIDKNCELYDILTKAQNT